MMLNRCKVKINLDKLVYMCVSMCKIKKNKKIKPSQATSTLLMCQHLLYISLQKECKHLIFYTYKITQKPFLIQSLKNVYKHNKIFYNLVLKRL